MPIDIRLARKGEIMSAVVHLPPNVLQYAFSRACQSGAPLNSLRATLSMRRTQKSGKQLQVLVRDNNVEQALRVLKKKMQREGVFREMKARRSYEKPSEKRVREKAEAIRRVAQGGAQAGATRRAAADAEEEDRSRTAAHQSLNRRRRSAGISFRQ